MNKIIKKRIFKIDGLKYRLYYQDCEESQSAIRKIDLAVEVYNAVKRAIRDSENILKGK
jgi:hypothetical protein